MQLRPQGRSSFQVLVLRDLGLAFWGLSEVPAREKFGGYIRVILGLYWENGKENGNYDRIIGLKAGPTACRAKLRAPVQLKKRGGAGSLHGRLGSASRTCLSLHCHAACNILRWGNIGLMLG